VSRLVEDPACFALVIPTYQGTPFLRRLLEFLRSERYLGLVVLSDNSTAEHRDFVASCPRRYPELWLEVQAYDPDAGFLHKLVRTFERLEARFVMLCGQDDFLVPEALERLLQTLEADPGLSCARGRVARFHLRPVQQEGTALAAAVEFNKHPMLAYGQGSPVERVLAHMRAYSSTLYSVHRRDLLVDSFRATDEATRNVVFWQYLSSCITVALGRVGCLDELFLARQIHGRSWSASLNGDREHWPLLVTSPRYSSYYAQFREALAAFLCEREACGPAADIAMQIDEAFGALISRAFCRTSHSDAGNDAFFRRLQEAGSADNARVNAMASFALPHVETY
jgi:glycosyltransferase domain-containing protein